MTITTPQVPKPHLQRLEARAKVAQKTTTIILASAATIGVIILLFGGYSIYQAYMRQTSRHQQQARSYIDSLYHKTRSKRSDVYTALTPNRNTNGTAGQKRKAMTTYRDTWSDAVPRGRPAGKCVRRPDPYLRGIVNTEWNRSNRWVEPTQRAWRPQYPPSRGLPAYPPRTYSEEPQRVPLSRRKPAPATPPQSTFASSIGSSPTRRYSLDDEINTPNLVADGALPPLSPTAHTEQWDAASDTFKAMSHGSYLISSLDDGSLQSD